MSLTNPNKKGSLGEIAVTKELLKLGYEVFLEAGSSSKVDLIFLTKDYRPIKMQIKTTESKNDVVLIPIKKKCLNPKYNSKYTTEQIDIFAIYVIDLDKVLYITAHEALRNDQTVAFRISEPKNKQTKNIRFLNDYLHLDGMIAQLAEQDSLKVKVVGSSPTHSTT